MKKPLITIGVPVYNVANYIDRCANSLLSQTYENIEYLFVDDHTPDDSISVLHKVIDKYPQRKERVKIVSHEVNKGIAEARNTIIRNCEGDFLMFVDSDDWIDEVAVENLVKTQLFDDYDIVAFDAIAHYPNSDKEMSLPDYQSPEDMMKTILYKGSHAVWGKLFKTALFVENGVFCEPGVNYGEDIQLLSALAFYAKRIINLHEPYYHYNCQNANSYVSNPSEKAYVQTIQSYNIVKSFFDSKGKECALYADIAELQGLLYEVRIKDDKRFHSAICRIHQLGKAMKNYVPKHKRIVYFTKNKFIIQSYFKITICLKNRLKKVK